MEPKRFTINQGEENEFQILHFPLKPLTILHLDKRLMSLFTRALGSAPIIDASQGDDSMDTGFFLGFSEAMDNLSKDDMLSLFLELFSTSQLHYKDRAYDLNNENSFNEAFQYLTVIDIYKTAFKIMRENCFSFFALAEQMGVDIDIGSLMGKTDS